MTDAADDRAQSDQVVKQTAANAVAAFRPVRNNTTGKLDKAITPDGIYNWCVPTRRRWVSRSARMRSGPPPPPTRSITRPTSPRCRSGSGMPTSPPRESTIIVAHDPKTVQRSRSPTKKDHSAHR